MACNTNSLNSKIVISICDGKKLGHICNYEVDLCDGRITAIFVPGESLRLFGKAEERRIPWEKIQRIGEDAILVDIPAGIPNRECACPPPQKRKWFW